MRWWWRLDGSLLSHPGFSWLDPLFSVWRKWWRGPRPPALSRSVSHTSSSARVAVCACVCGIKGQGQPISLQTITSHRAKYIPTPSPQPPVCKVVWCGNSRDHGGLAAVQTEASEARWRETCSTLIWVHFTHVRESFCTGLVQCCNL